MCKKARAAAIALCLILAAAGCGKDQAAKSENSSQEEIITSDTLTTS